MATTQYFNVPVCNVGLDETEHLLSSLRDLDEDTVVDLQKTEELQDLAGLGRNLVDTPDTDDEVDLRLGRDVEVARGTGSPSQADLLTLRGQVLLDVLLSTLEDDLALGLRRLDCPSQSILL